MVKVIKQRKLKKQKERRAKSLIEIANRTVGDTFQASESSTGNVRLVEKDPGEYPLHLWVMASKHHRAIYVDSQQYESRAKKLAKAYKDAGLGRFVVEAHY